MSLSDLLPLAATLILAGALGYRLLRRLQAAQSRFQAIFRHAGVGMAQVTTDRRFSEVNPALCRMLGYHAEQLTQMRWNDLTHPDDITPSQVMFDSLLSGQRDAYTLYKRYLRADGSTLYTRISVSAVRPGGGEIAFVAVVVEDVTQSAVAEQRAAQQAARSLVLLALPQHAERLDEPAFMSQALDQACTLTGSRSGRILMVGHDGQRIDTVARRGAAFAETGVDRQPIGAGSHVGQVIRRHEALLINSATDLPLPLDEPPPPLPLLAAPVVDNGTVVMLFDVCGNPQGYGDYERETLQLVANETWRLVRRQRDDRSLRQAMQVVNASPVVCFRWLAEDGWPLAFVSENVRQWGYTPEQLVAGQPDFASLIHPDDLERVTDGMRQTARCNDLYEQEYRLITADRRVVWVLDRTVAVRGADGQPTHYDGVLTDVTERRRQQRQISDNLAQQQKLNQRLEEANNQLLQSEKMASIGQLAAGIAHELNNPIGFVHSNLGTLDGYLHDLMAIIDAYETATQGQDNRWPQLRSIEQLREERDFNFIRQDIFNLLAESKEGLGRVRKIVQDLKTFSRVGEQEWQEADLHQGIDSTLNIVWNELKYKCEVVKDYGDLPPVYCLISQLNQVFMNLLVNAGHAIQDKGTITIRTRSLDAERVRIEISDTGCGIAPENLRRIFEPFFTTKPVGKGTGLGLSVSYNIVQRHQGKLEVESQPGSGTTFRITLPIRPIPEAAQEKTP